MMDVTVTKSMEDRVWDDDFPWHDPETNFLRAGWYSLDDVLARAIIPALDRMIEDNNGSPAGMLEDDVDPRTATPEQWDAAHAKWEETLRAIREGFQAHLDLNYNYKLNVEQGMLREHERRKGLRLFAEWYEHLWD